MQFYVKTPLTKWILLWEHRFSPPKLHVCSKTNWPSCCLLATRSIICFFLEMTEFSPGKGPILSTVTVCLQTFFTPLRKPGVLEPRHQPGVCGGVKSGSSTQLKLWAKQVAGEKRSSPPLLGHPRRTVLCSWFCVGAPWPWASLWKWQLPCEKQQAGVWEDGHHWEPCSEPQSLRAGHSSFLLITRRSWLGCQDGWLRLQEFFALLASPAKERKLPCIWHPSGGHGDWWACSPRLGGEVMLLFFHKAADVSCFLRWLCIWSKSKLSFNPEYS